MRNLLLIVGAALLFSAAPVTAQTKDDTRYYDVEVLIFENLDPRSRQAELWPSDVDVEQPEQFVQLGQPYPGPIPANFDPKLTFKALPDSGLQLDEAAKLLENSDHFHVLLHRAWRQPGMDNDTALPVYLEKTFTAEPRSPQPLAAGLAPSPEDSDNNGEARLSGYIRIVLSRYLHAQVDMVYTTGIVNQTPDVLGTDYLQSEAPKPTIYHLKQTRRMRSDELHYLDHPVLGMLILITPYEDKTAGAG
jgi:hypothetical protein